MFRYKLQQLLYGKYGNDNLNNFILGAMVVCACLNIVFRSRIVYIIQILLFVLWLVRFLSKNLTARANENEKYLAIKSKIFKNKSSSGYGGTRYGYNNYNNKSYDTTYTNPPKNQKKDKGYKYFKCPNCSAKLRVPKKKGKITITCPKCRFSFKGKS